MRSDSELAWTICPEKVAAKESQTRIRNLKLRVVGECYVHVKAIETRVARNVVAYSSGLISKERE